MAGLAAKMAILRPSTIYLCDIYVYTCTAIWIQPLSYWYGALTKSVQRELKVMASGPRCPMYHYILEWEEHKSQGPRTATATHTQPHWPVSVPLPEVEGESCLRQDSQEVSVSYRERGDVQGRVSGKMQRLQFGRSRGIPNLHL